MPDQAAVVKDTYEQYQRGVRYKKRIGLYDTVVQNENFFIGKQWEGVDAPNLDKPVLNILGRVVSYLVSVLVGERIGVSVSLFNAPPDKENAQIKAIIEGQIERIFEENSIMHIARELMRNCVVDGDCCVHLYYAPNAVSDLENRGKLQVEIVENTNVFFGNPAVADKEKQPYILIASRRPVAEVKEEMLLRNAPARQINHVLADTGILEEIDADQGDKVTVICKYFRHGDTIWVTKTTATALVMPPVDTGYRLYPLAYMCWEKIKNSYHGQAALTGVIPNQIAINKLMAMAIKYQKEMAFPKILFDRTKIDRWSNQIGAIGVNGDPSTAIFRGFAAPDMSGQVMMMIDRLISYTRDLIGASDAALGSIRPDNASAIVTVVRTTAVPLALQRRGLYQFYEEIVRSALDILRADYGVRKIVTGSEEQEIISFDFSTLETYLLRLGIDAGAGSFYSEADQIQTLDGLFSKGIITDPVAYLQAIPASYLPNKNALIASVQTRKERVE